MGEIVFQLEAALYDTDVEFIFIINALSICKLVTKYIHEYLYKNQEVIFWNLAEIHDFNVLLDM